MASAAKVALRKFTGAKETKNQRAMREIFTSLTQKAEPCRLAT
jgi:hypothetical protein